MPETVDARPDVFSLTREELRERVVAWGFSPVHTETLWHYLHYACVDGWGAMPDVPAKVRVRAEAELRWGALPVAFETESRDGFTRKYLLSLTDERRIETVLMRFTGRVTACVSSQVGCAMGCVFCATGQMGYVRHLSAGEIVAQVRHVQQQLRHLSGEQDGPGQNRLRNVVLMGMGEPLHNYDAVMKAIDILRDPNGLSLGASKITLSTVGVVPGIRRLADEKRPIHLAVSLHGATQEERAALVPAARKWTLDELMDACRYFCAQTGRRIFFEWTLIEGKNDSVETAHRVGELLRGMPAQVNLIPLNPTSGYNGSPAALASAKRFQAALATHGLPSTVRQRRGIDIDAGCGQLAVTRG
ncbi:23S rRNA (adenine(2503)-C(2))-methyltransferase RlmN [Nibricoccus sp. IMCC34717]|uniref:23S rRNA (adenine(2503)-C(2))-methyltransferase RlmN n=1 Tax=Nibricoccus sp. IMCC34717 TaxID=3034021 RepID=UPI0038503C9C